MKKLPAAILILCSSYLFTQTKITAGFNKSKADSLANIYASEASLFLVQSTNVDSNGLSENWNYAYLSESDLLEYHFTVYADSVRFEKTEPLRVGIGVINIEWIDSDSALTVIKNNGGRTFIQDYPNCTVSASLVRYVAPPFDTYWEVCLETADSTVTQLQNAETGKFTTSVFNGQKGIDINFVIDQNYPNPFNPMTTIHYSVKKYSYIWIRVYNINGSEVTTLVNEHKNPGTYHVEFSGKELSSGVYFCRIDNGVHSKTIKMFLVK